MRDVPHEVAVVGFDAFDRQQLTSTLGRLVEAAVDIVGAMPYRHYTFLMLGEGRGGQLYVKINGTRTDCDASIVDVLQPAWQLWTIDLSTAGNVSNVETLTIGIEGAGASGVVDVDDIRLY